MPDPRRASAYPASVEKDLPGRHGATLDRLTKPTIARADALTVELAQIAALQLTHAGFLLVEPMGLGKLYGNVRNGTGPGQ